jgi:hypothetical protein
MNAPWEDSTLAANGRPARENFAAWFGPSEVVDAQGSPLTVYHGAGSSFAEFDGAKAGSSSGHSTAKAGHFFTTEPDIAAWFAGEEWTGWPPERGYAAGANVMPVYLAIRSPISISANEFLSRFVRGKESFEVFAAMARVDGHDGIAIRGDEAMADRLGGEEYSADAWVAFKPEQIKSAIGNSGLYAQGPSLCDTVDDFETEVQDELEAERPRERS